MSRVAVVTDSTAYLPAAQAAAAHVTVVPVQVIVGGETMDETSVSSNDIADALREWRPISTSRPSPSAFVDAYQRLALGGADEIVSVHLSGAMSATVESAELAAKEVSLPVHVIDSRSVGMGLGFPVLAAAQAAADGATAAKVEEIVRRRSGTASVLFYVDTLEYLRRGGRIGKAAALVGSALSSQAPVASRGWPRDTAARRCARRPGLSLDSKSWRSSVSVTARPTSPSSTWRMLTVRTGWRRASRNRQAAPLL